MYWFDRGDFEAAEAWWRRSLELAPDSEDVKRCLARLPAFAREHGPAPDVRFESGVAEFLETSPPIFDATEILESSDALGPAEWSGAISPPGATGSTGSIGRTGAASSPGSHDMSGLHRSSDSDSLGGLKSLSGLRQDESEPVDAFDVSDRLILDEFTDFSAEPSGFGTPVIAGAAVPGLDVKPGWLMPSWLPRPAGGGPPDLQPTELDLTGRATEPDGALSSPWDEGPATTSPVTMDDAHSLDPFGSFDPAEPVHGRGSRDLFESFDPLDVVPELPATSTESVRRAGAIRPTAPAPSPSPAPAQERAPSAAGASPSSVRSPSPSRESIPIEAPAWPDGGSAFRETTPDASDMGHYELVGQGAVEMTGELARAFGRPWARSVSQKPMFEVVPVAPPASAPPAPAPQTSTERTMPPSEPKGPPLWDALLRGARDRFALHDFAGALELLERILAESGLYGERPAVFSEARTLLEESRAQLLKIFASKLGSLDSVPHVVLSREEIIWLNLNHRSGFVLSQIDGTVSCEDLVALSGMSRLDTLKILTELLRQGVIALGPS
ncbi:MAG: hypothetical protein IPK13_15775 [Deltaproteobacteria bacterium]|nr:hypothetical protein [Deltaproteobacteria bacterium]